ncbi:MAG: hypothetical protein M3459_05510 [Actinomycetota bacterium]|nr:hypothetical protein [Actinomycetota bacterium]
MPNPKSWFGRGNTRALLISGAILALFVSTSALAVGEGEPIEGGERNPTANQTQQFEAETQIIGDIAAATGEDGGYVTRQSNTQTGANAGGAAIYGCRAPAGGTAGGKEACLRANNLGGGTALELRSNGLPALFQVGGNPATAVDQPPFATNATGMVANLNADKVDGLDAEQISQAGNLFARVNDDATAVDGRGTTEAARTGEGVYTVTLGRDVSGCAFQATQVNTENPGPISVQLTADTNNQVTVRTFDEAEADDPATPADDDDGNQPADRAFHLTVTC